MTGDQNKKNDPHEGFWRESVSRRFSLLSLVLGPLVMLLATFCKSETRSDQRRKDGGSRGPNPAAGKKPSGTTPGGPGAEPGKGPGEEGSSSTEETSSTDCDAAIKVNLNDFEAVDEALETRVKVYGEPSSAMVVIDLPKYQHGLLDGLVLLLLPSGRVVAQRGVDPLVDIKEDTTVRPLVFDAINLKTDRQLAVLFRLGCPKCSTEFEYKKFVMKEVITFVDTFDGKRVISLTSSSAPADFFKSQALPIVGPDPKSNKFDIGELYTIAAKGAGYTVENIDDCYITDLVGNILSVPKAPIKDFTNYPEFIVYRPLGATFYVRTFVRLF